MQETMHAKRETLSKIWVENKNEKSSSGWEELTAEKYEFVTVDTPPLPI